MSTSLSFLALLAVCASASNPDWVFSENFLVAGATNPDSMADQVFAMAGRQPNVSNTVTFALQNGQNSETWMWRVNATEVRVPNNFYDLGSSNADFSANHSVANVQFQLQWPSSGANRSLQSYLQQNKLELYYIASEVIAVSGTTAMNRADGNCSAILGSQCTQSVQSAAYDTAPTSERSLSGCENTIGTSLGLFAHFNSSVNDTKNQFFLADTLQSWTSHPSVTLNQTVWTEVKSTLSMLILTFTSSDPFEHTSLPPPVVLCQFLGDEKTSAAIGRARPATFLLMIAAIGSLLFCTIV